MSEKRFAVIMAGGRGERFWPLSTSQKPKQLLSLVGGKPLLQIAVDRLEGLLPVDHIYVITNADLVDATCEAAPDLNPDNVIGEPFGCDTAAACALGLALVKSRQPDGAFAILTADHIIGDLDLFRATLQASFDLALQHDVLITIGINPTYPSSGYGYIETGTEHSRDGEIQFMEAERFVEKPDEATAQKYLDSGRFYWNSGMFIWSVASLEKAFAAYRAPLTALIDAMTPVCGTDKFYPTLTEEYGKLERISIDYAVMEHAENILTAKGMFAWDDVGAWPAIANHFDTTEDDNVVIGQAEVVDARDNIVVSEGRMTALIGVHDLVVVQADGATLICPKSRAQDVKALVSQLRENPDHDHLL